MLCYSVLCVHEILACVCAENPCFWEHEWDCHGSCSGFKQQDYFQKTLDLHKRYDIAVRTFHPTLNFLVSSHRAFCKQRGPSWI